MVEPATDRARKVAALAARLRLVQGELSGESADLRKDQLRDELDRALGGVPPGERGGVARELLEQFPVWSDGSGPGPAAPEGPSAEAAVAAALRDPARVVSALAAAWGSMPPGAQKAALDALRAGGVIPGSEAGPAASVGGAGLDDTAARDLRAKLGLGAAEGISASRVGELAVMLVEYSASLDQLVWNIWSKRIAPNSRVRKAAPLQRVMARFAAGDPDATRLGVSQELAMSRQLAASLTASIAQAGRQFARVHLMKFNPSAIEAAAKPERKPLEAFGVTCWRKYNELASSVTEETIEAELLGVVKEYVESLAKGLG